MNGTKLPLLFHEDTVKTLGNDPLLETKVFSMMSQDPWFFAGLEPMEVNPDEVSGAPEVEVEEKVSGTDETLIMKGTLVGPAGKTAQK